MPQKTKSESSEQASFVSWFKTFQPRYLIFAIPNGHVLLSRMGKAIVEGLLKGIPDICICVDGGRAIFIEMKKAGEKPTPEQFKIHLILKRLGFPIFVCYSDMEARTTFLRFMNEKNKVSQQSTP